MISEKKKGIEIEREIKIDRMKEREREREIAHPRSLRVGWMVEGRKKR